MDSGKNVSVIVLGDIGRSPRMQYHSLSLADKGHKVDVIGYGDTPPMDDLKKHPKIFHHFMLSCPEIPFRLLNYLFKTIWQSINLIFLLAINRKPDYILFQNPPAIPALIICWIFAILFGADLVIDWHNYAHTIMALSNGDKSKLVAITRKVETFIGTKADFNLCVTNAMRLDLEEQWGIKAVTLYDRPPAMFRSITTKEKEAFLRRFAKKYDLNFADSKAKPALLVSSTSWTEDEDFSVLFAALKNYETQITGGNSRSLPNLICVITGKGNLKDYYCEKIEEEHWKHVKVLTPWLEMEDYPLILASSDLGVCLHTSSSGLDLPMKVVDMFGCGLPVCAYSFKCLDELVQQGKNGYTFSGTDELTTQLVDWFDHYPNNKERNETETRFKKEIEGFQALRWQENWNKVAGPIFQ